MGILGLSNTLAKEGAKYNINVNCVVPVAESKMTSTILPPHILSMLKPEHIAPFVAYLAHEDTRLTGGIFEVGAGWFSQVRFERSSGVSLGTPEQPASLETIRDQFERITDFTSSSHPTQISDSLRDMLANQSTAPSPSTNAAEAIINKVNQSPVAPEPVSAPSSTSTSLQSDKVLSALQLLLSSDSTKRVELVGKVAGSVQFHIGDSKYTKKWLVNLKTASDAVVREVTTQDGRSDVLVKCTDQVFMSLIQGKVSPEYAYFRGELEIKGNPQQIMKVKSLIEYAKLQKV